MAATDSKPRRRKWSLKRRFRRSLVKTFNRVDFYRLAEKYNQSAWGKPWVEVLDRIPAELEDRQELVELTYNLAAAQMEAAGTAFNHDDLLAEADAVTTSYTHQAHQKAGPIVLGLTDHLFVQQPGADLALSPDKREIATLPQLMDYRRQGTGVLYLCNHSSHVDEFIVDSVLNQQGVGVPFFAAGANMMAIDSLAAVLMVGSYLVRRRGAGRLQLTTLYNHCRAISELGLMQSVFLEAWRGGARSRDGSLRYPRRLVTLRGAIDTQSEVIVQPVAVSYSIVPEDMPLAESKGALSWLWGMGLWRTLGLGLIHPKTGLWRALENIYGRAYCSFGRPMPLSELRAQHASDRGDLELDEFVSLAAIREIARVKKVMASQLTARGLVRALRDQSGDLTQAVADERDRMIEYHQSTFGHEPDFEDFILTNDLETVIADGLKTLKRRRVLERWGKDDLKLPQVKANAGLNFYATHGDRRLYSPTARENVVIVGAGDWGFSLSQVIGNRLLEDKRYLNASLTLFDQRGELLDEMGLHRRPVGRFNEHRLTKNTFLTSDPPTAFRKASEIILAVPPREAAELGRLALEQTEQSASIIIAGWGFDQATGRMPIQILTDVAAELGRKDVRIYALGGQVNDEDLVLGRPVEGVLAGPTDQLERLMDLFNWPPLALSGSSDPVGVQAASTLSAIYGLWGGFLMKQGRLKGRTQIGLHLIGISREAISLALAWGGRVETFSAASAAWAARAAAVGLGGPYVEFGRKTATMSRRGRTPAAAAAKIAQQLAEEGKPVRAYYDLKGAYAAAKAAGLELPILFEAHQTLWGD